MAQPAGRSRILALVFAATALNYIDRQTLALLKPTLETHFRWSDSDFANLGSAFQFSAAFALLGAGWFVDRVGLRRGYAIGVGLWSLAGMAHAAAASVGQFVAARVALGVAEAVNTPAAVKTAAERFPGSARSFAIAVINTAPNAGAIITPLFVPALALVYGWQAAFVVPGALGLVWLALWLAANRPEPAREVREGQAPPRWLPLLGLRQTWAIAGAKTLIDQVWWFLLFWTPDFFHRQFGLGQGELGLPVAFIYVCAAAGALSAGTLTSRLPRPRAMLLFGLLVLPVPLALSVSNAWSAAAIIGLALFAHQGFSTTVFALAADLFPAAVVGSVVGIGAFCGNMAPIAGNALTVWSLAHGHGYTPMFVLAAVSYVLAAAWVRLVLGRGMTGVPT